ncbi:CoA transferase [Microbacterium elymi]|uniref:CoA transferase n=1 Tax=Microbacterium elymi TaxID=2909587 RepID=A0ABY5NHL1_9MICO|nr:CoA transferase [Microbacterium elymi]UUT34621.1 CoA transferase [Microbacterium elymi]
MNAPDQQNTATDSTPAALAGVRVLDVSTLFAGPLAATFLGDFGADVIKVEHPDRPDAARGHGPQKQGASLWWKTLGRNKRDVTINLSQAEGAEILLASGRRRRRDDRELPARNARTMGAES